MKTKHQIKLSKYILINYCSIPLRICYTYWPGNYPSEYLDIIEPPEINILDIYIKDSDIEIIDLFNEEQIYDLENIIINKIV